MSAYQIAEGKWSPTPERSDYCGDCRFWSGKIFHRLIGHHLRSCRKHNVKTWRVSTCIDFEAMK